MPTVSSIIKDIWFHPANQSKRLRALYRFAIWQIYKRVIRRHIDIPVYNMTLRVYPDSTSASAVLYFNGLPDYHEMQFINHYLRPGDAFIDVGANVGVYTLLAASVVGKNGFIDAFEPHPKALERLRENIFINGLTSVRIHPAAVGSVMGMIQFDALKEDTCSRIASDSRSRPSTIRVPCVMLDQIVERYYAMGKMDIEGAEPLALKGSERLLSQYNPPVWQLELAGYSKRYGSQTHEIIEWLFARGYEIALYDSNTHKLNYTQEHWKQGATNVLAIASGLKDKVLKRIQEIDNSR